MHWLCHFVGSAVLIYFMVDQLTFLWVRRVYEIVYKLFIRVGGGWVIFIDLDGLKKINDELGHHVGDRVLRETGRVILKEARLLGFRYGGDEFVILFRGSRQDACLLAERIRNRVSRTRAGEPEASVSVGIGPTAELADKELYKAKAAGKNSVA